MTLSLLLAAAHRLPAPISEAPDQPTPAATQASKPARKHSAKPKAKKEENSDTGQSTSSATPKPSGVARNLTGPRPQYPAEAAGQNLTGKGSYVLHFDTATGNVIDVTVAQSTGSALLDQASIAAFRQWHEDPNGPKEVTMNMTFQPPVTE